jgi:hypothetical protein
MDPDKDPDPAIFVNELQDGNKIIFFALKVHLHNFLKLKFFLKSHKEVTKQ